MDYKVGIIGDRESILGFGALGLTLGEATDADSAEQILSQWADESYAVIFMTEELAESMGSRLAEWRLRYLPAVTVIPSARREAWLGKHELRTAIRRATGIDMIGQRDKIAAQEEDKS
jgi:V/A-type H+-transporting ATPase subunit F